MKNGERESGIESTAVIRIKIWNWVHYTENVWAQVFNKLSTNSVIGVIRQTINVLIEGFSPFPVPDFSNFQTYVQDWNAFIEPPFYGKFQVWSSARQQS